jgi:hypothetical protein
MAVKNILKSTPEEAGWRAIIFGFDFFAKKIKPKKASFSTPLAARK